MKTDRGAEEIIKRLNILIALNLDRGIENSLSMADKIAKLKSLGVSTADIAEILDKTANYITATLSQIKNKEEKKGKQK